MDKFSVRTSNVSFKLSDRVFVRKYKRFRNGQYEDVCAHYRRWPQYN